MQIAPLVAVFIAVSSLAIFQAMRPQLTQLSSLPQNGDTQQVKLQLTMPNVRSAAVIGSFNDWRPGGYEMRWNDDEGAWTVTLRLPRGRYEYAFVVDDQIIPDPVAGIYQDDGFGNLNAVLMVGNGHETQI
jgi:1,4-alpha-glucan branching enzyme